MSGKDNFFRRGFFKIGDGRFWEDEWLGDISLAMGSYGTQMGRLASFM
jgi:hypothetical protein